MSAFWVPGDIVRLASGGPEMTVFKHVVSPDEYTECGWFEKETRMVSKFPPESLVPVPGKNPRLDEASTR